MRLTEPHFWIKYDRGGSQLVSDRFILLCLRNEQSAWDLDRNSIRANKIRPSSATCRRIHLRIKPMCVYNHWALTLHHEDDIRVERRVEEVHKSLGSELSCTGTGGVPKALQAQTVEWTQPVSIPQKPVSD